MSENTSDVLIVGAGASGLTLACDLRRRGVDCRIIEKQHDFFAGSRGKGLQPRTLEVFDDLGVVEAVTASGGPFPQFRGRKADQILWDRDLAAVMGLAPLVPDASAPYSMWMVPQTATERILRSRLASLGGTVEIGTELTAFDITERGVRAVLTSARGTEEVHCTYLVGCDGGHSFVRRHADIAFSGESGTYRSVIADLEADGLERGFWHIWMRSQDSMDRVTMCSLPGTGLFQFSAPVSEEQLKSVSIEALERVFAERAEGFPLRIRRIAWSTIYRLNVRLADRFRKGPVLLAGDAAHVHSPFGGQGINTSIQDAYNLGWKLEHALRGCSTALDTYESERMTVAADVLGLSSGIHRDNYSRASADENAAANRDIYQLAISYRASPLSVEARSDRGGVRAGARAPDAPCALGSGLPTRLFDLYRGPHWTVLRFGQPEAHPDAFGDRVRWIDVRSAASPEGGATHVVDREGVVARTYGISPDEDATLVIRPDGYLGMASSGETSSRVVDYLKTYGA